MSSWNVNFFLFKKPVENCLTGVVLLTRFRSLANETCLK